MSDETKIMPWAFGNFTDEAEDEFTYELSMPNSTSKLTVRINDSGQIVVERPNRKLIVRYIATVAGPRGKVIIQEEV